MIKRCIKVLLAVFLVIIFANRYALALQNPVTFPEGSIILPTDSCWQPNGDPTQSQNTNNPTCDPNSNDKSLFQLYALLYALLDAGDEPSKCRNNDGSTAMQKSVLHFDTCKQIPVYWIIKKTKTDPNQADLEINVPTHTSNLVDVKNSPGFTAVGDKTTPVYYTGGPFVIHANDLAKLSTKEYNNLINTFSSVKIHVANVPFSGDVDKVLVGKPPRVAVLNEGASDVLEDYLRAAGLVSWGNFVFHRVTARDILSGCLKEDPKAAGCNVTKTPFQLIWAPHWEIEKNWSGGYTPSAAEQTKVVQEIRDFLERGNAGFFECASIESLEGSQSTGASVQQGVGGFLVGADKTWPRIDTNAGCSDQGTCNSGYLKIEESPFWLVQCGGWSYKATGGHVHNLRPNKTKGYTWLTTKTKNDSTTLDDPNDPNSDYDDKYMGPIVGDSRLFTRFIHDDTAKLNNAYDPGATERHIMFMITL